MPIKVKTDEVKIAAKNIAKNNNNIKSSFTDVETSVKKMKSNWDGSGAEKAISTFKTIQNAYCNNRYLVIDDLVRFLNISVGETYENNEAAIKSAASKFR